MMLDADVVRARCGEIEQALDRLTRIRAAGREAFQPLDTAATDGSLS